jgi:hypothetical protein
MSFDVKVRKEEQGCQTGSKIGRSQGYPADPRNGLSMNLPLVRQVN